MQKNILLGVSGGSDSMALLDILRIKTKDNIIVAYVNYKRVGKSDEEISIVKNYCKKHKIKFCSTEVNYKKSDGNFEAWARDVRYEYYKKIYDEFECKALYLGHQMDDFIETYYLQKQRKILCDYYGIKKRNTINGMKVVRPLLNKTKKELEDYCVKNKIKTFVDLSNYDTKYKRNKIRKEIINKMSDEEKKNKVKKINKKNEILLEEKKRINKLKKEIIKNDTLFLDKFSFLKEEDKLKLIYDFIIKKYKKRLSINKGRLLDLIKKTESKKPNILLWEEEGLCMYKSYDKLVFTKKPKSYSFSYDINDVDFENESVLISRKGNKEDELYFKKDDFPLFIRTIKEKDKEIKRIFIENKIPKYEREKWPIIENKYHDVLLVLKLKMFYNYKAKNKKKLVRLYIKRK